MITINTNYQDGQVSLLRFPAGEWRVRIPDVVAYMTCAPRVTVTAHLTSSDTIMQLLLTVDALRRENPEVLIDLQIPYLPYARQDRVCNRFESLSVKVMADLINSMRAQNVTIVDCHSDVGAALIDNVTNVPSYKYLEEVSGKRLRPISDYVLVSPDAGAMKKTYEMAKYFGVEEVVCASKTRDTATGRITSTTVPGGLEGKHLLVVDDIFDGGFTFLQLGEAIREQNPASLDLFVTHGIFSKGYEDIKKYYDTIVSTNSFHPDAFASSRPDGEIDARFYFINLYKVGHNV